MALDIAAGMNFLHSLSPPLLHRDVKSPNILIKSTDYRNVTAKIADFGLTVEMLTGSFRGIKKGSLREVVNPTWLAPEILRGSNFGLPSDVYPFGVILWELYSRQHPYCYDFLSDIEEAILSKFFIFVFVDFK